MTAWAEKKSLYQRNSSQFEGGERNESMVCQVDGFASVQPQPGSRHYPTKFWSIATGNTGTTLLILHTAIGYSEASILTRSLST